MMTMARMAMTTTAPQTPTTICVTYPRRLPGSFAGVCDALSVGNGVAVGSGVLVAGRVLDRLNVVRDWLRDVLDLLNDVCDLLNDV
jgi:hypothetical protein